MVNTAPFHGLNGNGNFAYLLIAVRAGELNKSLNLFNGLGFQVSLDRPLHPHGLFMRDSANHKIYLLETSPLQIGTLQPSSLVIAAKDPQELLKSIKSWTKSNSIDPIIESEKGYVVVLFPLLMALSLRIVKL